MACPCETRTSTCRSFATISSGLYRFLAIAVLLDVKDIPQVGPLQWGWISHVASNVRFARKRTGPVIYEYTLETDLARFAYDNWTDLLYAPLRANYKPRLSWRGSFFGPPRSEPGGMSHRPRACPDGTPLA